ncbi:GNAT family N-acetyltransferase [Alcanivorax jadensis]|uniref:GNAT family N-acetyltransferase n=1 Tax=Alcanivorax jadensis TaxID=64988 RepID=UPI0026F19194|nr:GNAT family N-acetyltransferase [Alcanivorax jadensis]
MTSKTPFSVDITGFGRFHIRAVQVPDDIALIHHWLSSEHARYWGMQDMNENQLADFYRQLPESGTGEGFLGFHEGRPVCLIESYDPRRDPVGAHYPVQPGDRGMHVLVAPSRTPVSGFTRAVFAGVMDFMFRDQGARRVVVEPDERNERIHTLNRFGGFVYANTIKLDTKVAALAFCSREQFLDSPAAMLIAARRETCGDLLRLAPQRAAAHLSPAVWEQVNRLQIRKSLAELAHERLLTPQPVAGEAGAYTVTTDKDGIVYRFRARRLALNHWLVEPGSIEKTVDGEPALLDALAMIIELQHTLGIREAMMPTYMEEIASTLYGSAYKLQRPVPDAEGLVDADFQQIEATMSEGHPCFLANNGRIGFDVLDYPSYTPEAGSPVQLIWLAAHRDYTVFAAKEGLDYEALMTDELGEGQRLAFDAMLREQGVKPRDYHLIPVHPWQWYNKLASVFSADLAERKLICLGKGEDRYQAQQSIRTFYNLDQPEKRYVKTAISVLNMGFMRGLSPYYMSTTPAINDFLHGLVNQDPELADTGFTLLREVAGVGYRQRHFEEAVDQYSAYRKMLSALWRESPLDLLEEGEGLMTMAALLHVDSNGQALLPALIRRSGMTPQAWLAEYLRCYLRPLMHCFYQHDLVFMPHGENLIMVMKDGVPRRAIMKDIAEECAILNTEVMLADKVRRLAVDVPEDLKVLSLLTDVFDCFFRFMAAILVEHEVMEEDSFWAQVAECVHAYQADHPQLADKFARHDLFAPEFTLSCLNRLQLANNQQMVDLADPASALQFAGTLVNPIARWARVPEKQAESA